MVENKRFYFTIQIPEEVCPSWDLDESNNTVLNSNEGRDLLNDFPIQYPLYIPRKSFSQYG